VSQLALFTLAPSLDGVDPAALSSTYSADRIGTNNTIKKPLAFGGHLWVLVGGSCDYINAFRVVPIAEFDGKPTTYSEKGRPDGFESARHDPNGFYHGMTVSQGGTKYVMVGPEFTIAESAFSHFDSPAYAEADDDDDGAEDFDDDQLDDEELEDDAGDFYADIDDGGRTRIGNTPSAA
jgi:hypothetical protein